MTSAGPGLRLTALIHRFGWRHELLRVLVIYLVYEGVRIVPRMHVTDAVTDGRAILSAERRWHLAPEQVLNNGLESLPRGFAIASAYYYEALHYLVTPLVLVWLFRTSAPAYRRARNWLVAMTLPALLVFWLLPVVPPRLLPGEGFHDIVAEQHRWGWWSAHGTTPGGLSGVVNEYAAMPSLHVGWALWCGCQLIRHSRHRTARTLGVLYPIGTGLIVTATGNHYLLDALAGLAFGVFGWAATTAFPVG